MKDVSLYESFLTELRKKIPQGAKLTNTLVDMLYIEREAVYRRLRGEVPFTFVEVMTVAKELGISSSRYSLARRVNRTGRPVSRRIPFPNLFVIIIPGSRVFICSSGCINIVTWIR